MTAYVWYFTPVTRVGGSDNWTIANGVTSEPLNVWFGTTAPPAEDVALYDLIIVDNNSANGKVGSKELSDALSSAGFPGLTPANFGSIALTSIPGQSEKIHTVGFTTDQSIKSGEVGYVISLQPLPSGQINAPWQPGLGNFIEFWPGKLSDICFARGTMIDTPEGAKPIEALRVGDFICTKDHGPQPIRWIGASRRSAKALRQNPQVMPILIAKDTFGPDRPNRDLRVSPQHRIVLESGEDLDRKGLGEVLVAAKHLCGRSGVRVEEESQGVEYFHLLMDRHEIIFANGLEAETLFLGPMALLALPAEALDEIRALFPDLDLTGAKMAPARPLLTGREARALLAKRADMRAGLLESVE